MSTLEARINKHVHSLERPFLFIMLLFAMMPYSLINWGEYILNRRAFILETSWDQAIPFYPSWVFVYYSMLFLAFTPFLYAKDMLYYRRIFLNYCAMLIVAYACFLFFPTKFIRPSLPGHSFIDYLMGADTSVDPPYNCFPSLHVAYSYTAALALWRLNVKVGRWALVWAVLVTASTLFAKEHYIADVVSGMILAFSMDWVMFRTLVKVDPPSKDDHYSNLVLLIPLLLYVALMVRLWFKYKSTRP